MMKKILAILVVLLFYSAAQAVIIPLYDPYAVHVDGVDTMTANWDAGGYEIRSLTFESDVATGTAPFTIASTTVVANLNVDKADGYDFDQDVTTTGTPSFSTVNGLGIISTPFTYTLRPSTGSSVELAYTNGGAPDYYWSLSSPKVSSVITLSMLADTSLNQSLLTTSDVTHNDLTLTGTLTVPSLTLDMTQDFLFTQRAGVSTLAIQGQTANQTAQTEFFTASGDGTDDIYLSLYALGSPSSITDSESLQIGFDAAYGLHGSAYLISSGESGTGDLHPIYMVVSDPNQFLLKTDGNIQMSGDLEVIGAATGGSLLTGGDIGVAGDTTVLQLAAASLTVNGDITMGSDVRFVYTNNMGGLNDADTYIRFVGDSYYFLAGGVEFLRFREQIIGGDHTIFNEAGADIDWRVEGVGQANALFVQGSDGKVGIRESTPNYPLQVNGGISGLEKSADPAEPAEGEYVIWMSDGTGKGDDGDVLIASKAGGTTNWGTLFDHSGGAGW